MQTLERTTEQQIDDLEAVYRFRQPEEVRAYLAANPDLLHLLREAAATIPAFVTPTGALELEVFQNPEAEDDTAIVPIVPVDRDGPSVLPAMDRLLREWQIDAARFAAGRFVVRHEYR